MKPKNKIVKKEYVVGDNIELEMLKGDKGKMPIGRTPEGLICLIDRDSKGFYPYNSVWDCEIVKVFENKLFVKPLEMVKSAEANSFETSEKVKKLATPISTERKQKVKPKYQYNSKVESIKEEDFEKDLVESMNNN